ncbi:hypothetical protein DFS34DRAFT_591325 [Phlyctochytrium arcticum]|nr:hypothetical protein DFS34DRAFT_591325 [Phlyctochytrium arcticum]
MLENHVKPSPPLAVAFAEAFARFGTAEQFADVLSWMQASKYPLSDQKLKESILLSAATAGDSEKVESVFQELQKGSTKSPIGYLNWILMGYARGRHEQLLLDTFNRMESLGCRPDGNSFYHVLTYYAALGNTTKLKEWLAKMKEAGVTPSIPTYSTVLHGCFAAQDYDLAQEIVQEVEAEGRPVDYHFKALQARLAARTGDFKGALKQLNGIEGNSRASSPILWGDVAKALGPIKPSMTKTELEDVTGTILSHKALQNLISGYNHIKDPASAQAITNWIK